MRSKKVTRYYCGFCGRGGFQRPSMEQHELTCVKNPKRGCWICSHGSNVQEELAALSVRLDSEYKDAETREVTAEDLKEIRKVAADCPACILSVLILASLYACESFVYKDEAIAWHKKESEERRALYGF